LPHNSLNGTHEHLAYGCGFNSPSGWWLISTVPSQSVVRKEVTKEHRNHWCIVEFWILPHNSLSGTFEHLAYGCGLNSLSGWCLIRSTVSSKSAVRKEVTKEHFHSQRQFFHPGACNAIERREEHFSRVNPWFKGQVEMGL
jgi:hypothetical protein